MVYNDIHAGEASRVTENRRPTDDIRSPVCHIYMLVKEFGAADPVCEMAFTTL